MKVILSSVNLDTLEENLLTKNNIPEVYDYIMSLDYFCFISIENKNKLSELLKELNIYYSLFDKKLHINIFHNGTFYEQPGIAKLNFWSYFRNIIEKENGHLTPIQDCSDKISQSIYLIEDKIKKHNFNKKTRLIIKE